MKDRDLQKRTVIVIGAGMAGMAAARQLTLAGLQVTVLEKNSYVGGRVHTNVVDDFEVDAGAQFLTNFYTNTRHLIRELGLQDDLIPIPTGVAITHRRRLYKLSNNLSLIFTSLITWRSKLILLKTLVPLLGHWQQLDTHAFYKAYPLDTRPLAEYARQELNDELLEYVLQPPLSGIFYWTPEHTSQALLFLLFKAGLGMKLLTLRHGLGQLSEAMATNLLVQYNTEIISIFPNQTTGYTIQAYVNGQNSQFSADGIVCAIPATRVSALLPSLNTKQRAFFEAISYSTTVTSNIGLDHRVPADFYGMFCPRREIEYLAAASVQSAKNREQIPAGRDLLQLFSSGPAGRDLLDKDDATIHAKLLADLQLAGFPYDLGGQRLFSLVYRWPEALPEFDVGHFMRLKAFADGEIESGSIVFAGDYLGGPFIEGAITSGLEAAQRLLHRLS
jgi:oxygen-dependent protoporphyrinogen oxidase